MLLKLLQLVVKETVLKIYVFARVGEPKYLHLKETRLNLSISFLKIDPPLTARTWGT